MKILLPLTQRLGKEILNTETAGKIPSLPLSFCSFVPYSPSYLLVAAAVAKILREENFPI
jgi:hypothetical protein